MLDNGLRDPALKVLRTVARAGDDDWVRLYAMCKVAVADPTPDTRTLLNALIREDYVEGDAEISPWLIDEIINVANPVLLAAALGKAATPPPSNRDWMRLENAFRAASTLAKIDQIAGLAALEELASAPVCSLREQLEALTQISALDPSTDMADRVCELIDQRPFEIDWRVVQLLDRLNLDLVAWRAGVRYLRYRLYHHRNNYEAWSVLQQLALIAPSDEVDAFIREQLARRPSARLAASLSLVGRTTEARSLLTAMLDNRDPIRGIDAARELASLGEPKRAKQWLTRSARDRTLGTDIRLEAARVLGTIVDGDRSAASAMRKLVLDSSLTVDVRCRSALDHAELTNDSDGPIAEALAKLALDPKGTLADRVNALQTLATVDPHEEWCWDQHEIFDELLNDPALSAEHIPRLIATARQLEIVLYDEGLVEIVRDKTIPAALRLHGLSALRGIMSDRLPEIDCALLAICRDDSAPLKVRLSAIKEVGSDYTEQACAIIKSICEDKTLPPNWRLSFARHLCSDAIADEQSLQLTRLANDPTIAVSTRLEAYNGARRYNKAAPFPDFFTSDLTVFECIAIAEAAECAGLMHFGVTLLDRASAICDLSCGELVALHSIANKLQLLHIVADAAERIAAIPTAIFSATQDKHSVCQSIAIIAQTDQNQAADKLTELLMRDDVDLWEAPELIDALAQYVGTEEALRRARSVLDEVLYHLAESTKARFPTVHLAETYFDRGWLTDIVPLLAVANDPARAFDERVAAAVLANRIGGVAAVSARRLLADLIENPTTDLARRVIATRHLMYRGYHSEALHLARTCLATTTVSASDKLALSRCFADLGHSAIADDLLGSISLADLTHAFLLDEDKQRLKSIHGDARFDELMVARIHDGDDTYAGFAEARERITKWGDPKALQFLFEVASDADADPTDRLEAIDNIEQLGFRSTSRAMFCTLDIDNIEPLWVALQCERFGWKEQSRDYFRRAVGSCEPENLELVSSNLAELGAVEDLKLVEQRMRLLDSTIE